LGWQSSFIIYSLVILPPAAFFFAGLAKRVLPITIASLVFLVFHFAVTLESFPLW